MPGLRTAYLVLAHHQPDHLAKLVGCLEPADGVFIHIDLKADEGVFRNALGERRNAVFIKDRCIVNWGGFSQVEATLALLSAAFACRPSFHRYCLLSGSDYPIKSNCVIQAEFASHQEFLRIDRKVGSGENNGHCRNVASYWFMDSMDPPQKASSGSVRRDPYGRIGLYHGAQWWALTRDCVEYVFGFLASNPDYLTFFRYALCPDEIFFHSIVKHSPFASRISHDFEMTSDLQQFSLSNDHGCHYTDWNAKREDKLPKILDLADLDVLLASEALFARKFEGVRSAPLLSRLEESLGEVTPR